MLDKISFIDRVDYDKLPQPFKDKRQQLTVLGRQLRKLEKDKIKYQSKLTSIKTDFKPLFLSKYFLSLHLLMMFD